MAFQISILREARADFFAPKLSVSILFTKLLSKPGAGNLAVEL